MRRLFALYYTRITYCLPAVLTKPDRIDVGQHGSWIQLVQNQQEKFKHGWHVVKQSNQQQLEAKIPWKEARRNETKFFNETEPWTTLDDSFRQRLGTEYLAQSLGNILFGMIRKRYALLGFTLPTEI